MVTKAPVAAPIHAEAHTNMHAHMQSERERENRGEREKERADNELVDELNTDKNSGRNSISVEKTYPIGCLGSTAKECLEEGQGCPTGRFCVFVRRCIGEMQSKSSLICWCPQKLRSQVCYLKYKKRRE